MLKVFKIAITGAPCSGKTTVINAIEQYYKAKCDNVFVCPEAASQLINNGASREDYLAFETLVAKQQIENEKEIDEKIKACDGVVLVIYDRPLSDCFSYVEDKEALSDNIGKTLVSAWSRYDSIIMLGLCDEKHYIENDIRVESYETALDCEKRIIQTTLGHSHFRYIKPVDSIDEKIERVKAEIDSDLSGLEIEKKYLIEYPDFDKLSKYDMFKVNISQTYLLSSIGSHRVRKRGFNGDYAYIETLKIRIDGCTAEESERVITQSEYNELLKNADPDKHEIIKDRYCILFDGQFLEMDVYPFWDDKAFVEIEIKNKNDTVTLPPEIKVIEDVSNDKKYKNSYLAGLKL